MGGNEQFRLRREQATGDSIPALVNGRQYRVRSLARDGSNIAQWGATSRTFTADGTAPAAPSITDTDPNSPANDNSPEVKGSGAEAGSTVGSTETRAAPAASSEAERRRLQRRDRDHRRILPGNQTTSLRATATDPPVIPLPARRRSPTRRTRTPPPSMTQRPSLKIRPRRRSTSSPTTQIQTAAPRRSPQRPMAPTARSRSPTPAPISAMPRTPITAARTPSPTRSTGLDGDGVDHGRLHGRAEAARRRYRA